MAIKASGHCHILWQPVTQTNVLCVISLPFLCPKHPTTQFHWMTPGSSIGYERMLHFLHSSQNFPLVAFFQPKSPKCCSLTSCFSPAIARQAGPLLHLLQDPEQCYLSCGHQHCTQHSNRLVIRATMLLIIYPVPTDQWSMSPSTLLLNDYISSGSWSTSPAIWDPLTGNNGNYVYPYQTYYSCRWHTFPEKKYWCHYHDFFL